LRSGARAPHAPPAEGALPRSIGLIEPLEHPRLVFRGDPNPTIGETRLQTLSMSRQPNPDRAALRRELDGVVNQVVPYLAQHFFVSRDLRLFEIDVQLEPLGRPLRFAPHNSFTDLHA